MIEHSEKLDLDWLMAVNPKFKKYCHQVQSTKEDEQRYKDNPGYVPEFESKESAR